MKRISTFASRFYELRMQRKETLEEFSKLLGCPAQTLNRYERAERVPKIDIATQIAERLGVSPLWIFGYDVPKCDEFTYSDSPTHSLSPAALDVATAYDAASPAIQESVCKLLDVTRPLQKSSACG